MSGAGVGDVVSGEWMIVDCHLVDDTIKITEIFQTVPAHFGKAGPVAERNDIGSVVDARSVQVHLHSAGAELANQMHQAVERKGCAAGDPHIRRRNVETGDPAGAAINRHIHLWHAVARVAAGEELIFLAALQTVGPEPEFDRLLTHIA